MERRLAAILAADVVAFSRLMEKDEAATFERLRSLRKEFFEPLIASHRGRIFKLTGDGLLAEFLSATDAVECAAELQSGLHERERTAATDWRITLRIGISLGDVILEEEDRHGEGVNLAARLQQLAEPGGILISSSVREEVKNRLPVRLEPLGRHRLKNLAEPVTVYGVIPAGTKTGTVFARKLKRWASPGRITALLALIIMMGAIAFYLYQPNNALAEKPAVAVLPMQTIEEDQATTRLAAGLSEDIITDLARFREIDVIAGNSAKRISEEVQDIREIGRRLGVGYLVRSTIQRQGNEVRITAQLVDAANGASLWSGRWDRPVNDIFAVQSELAQQITGVLGSANSSAAITAEEVKKLKRRAPSSLSAYEHYLLAVEGRSSFTKESMFAAYEEATKAINLDPGFARAYAVRARIGYNTIHYGADFDTAMRNMEADARRAVELAPEDPDTRASLAWFLTLSGKPIESETEIRAALANNPSNVNVMHMAAAIIAANGYGEEGAALADKVLKIDPQAVPGTLNTIKDAYFFSRRYTDLVNLIARIPENARSRGSRLFLAMGYAKLGRRQEAEKASAAFREKYPTVSAELLLNQDWVFARSQEESLFVEGFRAAGLPLCATDVQLAKFSKPKRLADCKKKLP
jgi:class 3 adenylate cyclase/TolB-like protein/Tfp pilus assembly protein PilF